MDTNTHTLAPELDFDTPALARHRKFRALKERMTTSAVGAGGMCVIIAIMLIFIYLLYEVVPLFKAAEISQWEQSGKPVASYNLEGSETPSVYLTLEEQNEVALKIDAEGNALFFDAANGHIRKQVKINRPADSKVSSFALDSESSRVFALGLDNGQIVVAKHNYKISYPNDVRTIAPSISYPYGETPMEIGDDFGELKHLAVRNGDDGLVLVGSNKDQKLGLLVLSKEENFMTEEIELSSEFYSLPSLTSEPVKLLIAPDMRWIYALDQAGNLSLFDIKDPENPQLQAVHKTTTGQITDVGFLLGGASLMIADDLGQVKQWFLVRDKDNQWDLKEIRGFSNDSSHGSPTTPISTLAMEHRRKGFATADNQGVVTLYSATAGNQVMSQQLTNENIRSMAFSPRANALLTEDDQGTLRFWQVDNKHPEVSWAALWQEIWYEGYDKPDFVWQSSAATNDFEPKYSLMPLAFGTLKAAIYAMLMATPLAICGAIYTAYFMAPALRRKIKPFIELMEALPTVILGFLAGLWLAPFVETNLASIFTILLVVPVGTLVFAYFWSQIPDDSSWQLPDGWDAALLIPIIILLVWLSMPISTGLENLFFDGDLRTYTTRELGITYDQRNALVVGLAMGFAVIPTIFSITEDAIFSVPRHLTEGSLALGATPWQTLTRVVLPTASPGIFSAMMIGMGRAVGETMIVLMATGNTPIMDINIFEGMRTLAANIAVEMPESEVGSSHFRILFLAALVLFMFTFVVNTVAEVVRQHLRQKYGSL